MARPCIEAAGYRASSSSHLTVDAIVHSWAHTQEGSYGVPTSPTILAYTSFLAFIHILLTCLSTVATLALALKPPTGAQILVDTFAFIHASVGSTVVN